MNHKIEIGAGQRFTFGNNWSNFLKVLNEDRIQVAEKSLCAMLGLNTLAGRHFLDIGSGSGLFSLAARRLGAVVHSFDYDPESVACTTELRRRYFPDDLEWVVEEGSILDKAYLDKLGAFDIVYSWGVLHHTGAMWDAFQNIVPLIRERGLLFIAIYNDQGGRSKRWRWIKRTYNRLPRWLKFPYTLLVMLPLEIRSLAAHVMRNRASDYFNYIYNYSRISRRGMSRWHDIVDWIGGYPFEVAKPEEVFDFFRHRGFELTRLQTCGGGLGCNQYVFLLKSGDIETPENFAN